MLTFSKLPSQTTPCSFLDFRHECCSTKPETDVNNNQAMGLPDPITMLPDISYDCLETMPKEECKIFPTLVLITYPRLWAPSIWSPQIPHGVGHSSCGTSLQCSLLGQLRIKAIFLFSPDSLSEFFYLALVGRESQDFDGNKTSIKVTLCDFQM